MTRRRGRNGLRDNAGIAGHDAGDDCGDFAEGKCGKAEQDKADCAVDPFGADNVSGDYSEDVASCMSDPNVDVPLIMRKRT